MAKELRRVHLERSITMPRKARPLVSDEEKARWSATPYPKRELSWIRSIIRSYDLELQPMLAAEQEVESYRKSPQGKKLFGNKRVPRRRKTSPSTSMKLSLN